MSFASGNLALEINSDVQPPFKRSPELLIPDMLVPRAEEFEAAMDSFMADARYRLVELTEQRAVGLSRYEEDADLVYSIIHSSHTKSGSIPPGMLQAVSVIAAEDGRKYGERHWFKAGEYSLREAGGQILTHSGIMHPLRNHEDWHRQIVPVTRCLTVGRGLLKIVR